MKVSLIATVKDAGGGIDAFLASLAAQTRPPDEVVIVDGGSTDGTLEALRAASGIRVISEPGANISRGRNIAVASATHDVLAVTDADCVLAEDWLERLLVPIEQGAEVAMGAYLPITESLMQRAMAAVNLPDPSTFDEATFLPSARSLAVRRAALAAVGGWPEWLAIGEDMWVDLRWRELGVDMRLARDAIVRWPLRDSLSATWTQYARYARGDAIGRMHARRHAIRFLVYAGAVAGLIVMTPPVLVVLAIGAAAAYAAAPIARALRGEGRDRFAVAALTPFLLAWTDLAKMAGYISGLATRLVRDPRPPGVHPSGH